MRNKTLTVIGLVVGSGLLLAALVWAATGNGPYYALPAWDQKQAAATRFIVLTDWNSEAVLDRETGLVWEQSPATTVRTWVQGRGDCANKNVGGRKGWRLPSFPELASLVDPNAFGPPFLPPGYPFTNIQSGFYWSATTNADVTTSAWDYDTNSGTVRSDGKANSVFIWCVRGGMNADQY